MGPLKSIFKAKSIFEVKLLFISCNPANDWSPDMLLTQEFKIFCHAYFNKGAAWSDRMEFVNGWYLLIIVSDTLTIVGSAHKIGIQTKVCLCWLLSCRVCVCV